MRRLLPAALGVAVLVGASAAFARLIEGTDGADRIVGTASGDVIRGLGGNDVLRGGGGPDLVDGGAGGDFIYGQDGDDRLVSDYDGAKDTVACGRGRDLVNADLGDVVRPDCETVVRRLSRDPYLHFDGQHETQVEPDSLAFGSTIVVAFQSGRLVSGGAANIGWATSRDAGKTWRSGFLPATTESATPPGGYDVASDPVVAYDAVHRQWLIVTLARGFGSYAILISRSADGLRWGAPTVAASVDRGLGLDKEWAVCDNWNGSPFRGRCYLSYLDLDTGTIVTRSSVDGGLTWAAAVFSVPRTPSAITNGAQPVVRPDGSLLVLYAVFQSSTVDGDRVLAVRSTDGGGSFSAPQTVSRLFFEDPGGVRAPPLPSAEVDAGGTVYVAWADCRFREDCLSNDSVVASSADGVRWSDPVRVPIDDQFSHLDHFVPGLGASPTARGVLSVAYHTIPEGCSFAFCVGGINVGIITSADGGRTWGTPQRLSAAPMFLEWLADTSIGRMLADYISTSWVGGRPIPVFSMAHEPDLSGSYRQAIYAGTRVGAATVGAR